MRILENYNTHRFEQAPLDVCAYKAVFMTEKEFTEISLTLGLTFGISYMLFIVYKLAEESNAGRYGMMVLFVGLGLGIFGFAAKYVIKIYLATQLA